MHSKGRGHHDSCPNPGSSEADYYTQCIDLCMHVRMLMTEVAVVVSSSDVFVTGNGESGQTPTAQATCLGEQYPQPQPANFNGKGFK